MTKEDKKDNLAYNFHTCLRKCMDSRASSICHLTIGMLDDKIWSIFIDKLYGKEITLESCLEALDIRRDNKGERVSRTSEMILFKIGLEMLDKQEWEVLNKTCL